MGKTPRKVTPAAAVKPKAMIRAMILCIPAELPREALTAHQLDRNFGVRGTLSPRFWASTALHRWQHRQMISLRKGRPASCAGGPAKLLDLDGMLQAAAMGAGIRHQLFSRVVHGTRNAVPWHVYEARHLAAPDTYPWDKAVADFNNQPRVNAIRMHNAATYGAGQIALAEVEMYQAGYMAYQHYSALTAVAGDALITTGGATLAPASAAMADRVTYLEQANRLFAAIDPDQRLLAVAL
ncbi:hypothetical protein [Micromonospora maris]|uniref:Uncharacterized protein n=1 Tax=Micromonospora maris TaxID=1003110 RepID=A0A9X0I717_9ACTN|nr:hypothetical protein [Micromonospora maris]AEB42629.1 hypothetical protein VAB18032_07545 [Micromonospora maris AB-18-032]KUJ48071.1 hypothetical protein ADL17_03025 [Micromonospora maris]